MRRRQVGNAITVLFFGRLADCYGREMVVGLPKEGYSVGELRRHLAALVVGGDDILDAGRMRACVDDVMVAESARLGSGQEVDFFPPVSGG